MREFVCLCCDTGTPGVNLRTRGLPSQESSYIWSCPTSGCKAVLFRCGHCGESTSGTLDNDVVTCHNCLGRSMTFPKSCCHEEKGGGWFAGNGQSRDHQSSKRNGVWS